MSGSRRFFFVDEVPRRPSSEWVASRTGLDLNFVKKLRAARTEADYAMIVFEYLGIYL